MSDLLQSFAIVMGAVTSLLLVQALCRANERITKMERIRLQSSLDEMAAKHFPTDAAQRKAVEKAISEWPRLPGGAEFIPSPVDAGGVMLLLTPQALLSLRVDRAGRLSSTGFPLIVQLPAAGRGGHEG